MTAGWSCKLTSRALAQRSDLLVKLLTDKLQPAGIWLRTEKGIRDAEGLTLADGLLAGRGTAPAIVYRGARDSLTASISWKARKPASIATNATTARRSRDMSAGRSVLDMFCYSGGFGLSALKHGRCGFR